MTLYLSDAARIKRDAANTTQVSLVYFRVCHHKSFKVRHDGGEGDDILSPPEIQAEDNTEGGRHPHPAGGHTQSQEWSSYIYREKKSVT